MTGADALKQIMKSENFTQAQLAKLCGMKNQSNISEALKRDIKISLMIVFADAMGYEIVLQKKKQGKRPDSQCVLSKGGD